jgi:hypothetical protein
MGGTRRNPREPPPIGLKCATEVPLRQQFLVWFWGFHFSEKNATHAESTSDRIARRGVEGQRNEEIGTDLLTSAISDAIHPNQ